VRPGAFAQLLLGFREADIDADFTFFRARVQELERDGGLTGSGAAFQEVKAVTGESAAQNQVNAGYAGPCARQKRGCSVHGGANTSG
jgi:hypothetical protein